MTVPRAGGHKVMDILNSEYSGLCEPLILSALVTILVSLME